jgi:hypothetical protein
LDCSIYFKKDSVITFRTFAIKDITITKDKDSIPNLEFSRSFNSYPPLLLKLPLNVIDSIIFKNTNLLYGRIYNKIEIKIKGLKAKYSTTRYIYPPDHNESQMDTISIDRTFILKNKSNILSQHSIMNCYTCASGKTGNLSFCYDTMIFKYDAYYESCNYEKLYLLIDTINLIINTFNYNLIYQSSEFGKTGSYENTTHSNQSLVLSGVSFKINPDGSLSGIKEIDSTNIIQYDSRYSNYNGTHGSHTQTETSFYGFLPLTESATISIVIRE